VARCSLPKPNRRRALALLAEQPNGVPEAVMTTAYGFTVEQLVELLQAGLATDRCAGRNTVPIAVRWLMITDAGRQAWKAQRAAALL